MNGGACAFILRFKQCDQAAAFHPCLSPETLKADPICYYLRP